MEIALLMFRIGYATYGKGTETLDNAWPEKFLFAR
jgi:hypothetical protein